MKKLIIISIISIIFCYCSNKSKEESDTKKQESDLYGEIIFIFKEAPQKQFISTRENETLGGRTYFNFIASYLDKNGITQYLNPKREPFTDTLKMSTRSPKTEVYFNKLGLEGFSYLFSNGDHVLISYKNGIPHIEVINRSSKPYDYQFENFFHKQRNDELTLFEQFFRALPINELSKGMTHEEMDNYQKRRLEVYSKSLETELILQVQVLDSLYDEGVISEQIKKYYTQKIEYINWGRLSKLKELVLEKKLDSIFQENLIFKNTFLVKKGDSLQSEMSLKSIIKEGESLIQNRFYHDFLLHHFLPNYIENRTVKASYDYGNFGGNFHEWDRIFDSIQSSSLFPEKVKNFLLYHYMNKIASDLSPEIVKKYYQKFKALSTNQDHQDLINQKFKIDSSKSNKLTLQDPNNHTFYLEDILNENIGKPIYVDFWASWCKPCIELIPFKQKLKEDYPSIVFISISIDDDVKAWRSAKGFKIFDDLEFNYRITNPLLSDFIKKNQVVFVPRYFLFSKTGEMVDPNAPKPNTKEIRYLFDQQIGDVTYKKFPFEKDRHKP